MVAKILKFLQKFKSQKGATGADIVVALSIIVLTVGTVSLIYVNVTKGSRKVNRTAGATRIATNILENIDGMSYDQFLRTITNSNDANTNGGIIGIKTDDANGVSNGVVNGAGTITVNGAKNGTIKIFSTKVPKGYTVELTIANKYSDDDTLPKFDLMKEISVNVKFKVSDEEEVVSLSTSKTREEIQAVNKPDINTLEIASGKAYVPIKYSKVQACYVVTSENDSDWYNYESKIWAMVYVDTTSEIAKIKQSGKITTVNNSKIYYWIPRFSNDGKALYNASNYPIEYTEIQDESNNKLTLLTVGTKAVESSNIDAGTFTDGTTGFWIAKDRIEFVKSNELTNISVQKEKTAKTFLSTKFGPVQY